MSRIRIRLLCFVFSTFFIQVTSIAQPLNDDFKKTTVRRISELVNQYYVFPDVAQATGNQLQSRVEAGAFNKAGDLLSFARQLSLELQEVNHDKHMRVRVNTNEVGGREPRDEIDEGRGFKESKILDGNIGYIDMRGFVPVSMGAAAADEHMKRVASVDALIIDLRRNGGGDPAMVQYLCSYFFEGKIHLNSLYFRPSGTTTEFWTVDVKGIKMPDVPLYVLTSPYTFSAAEEFAYNMQTQHRATLVGETTGGGANPGERFVVNDKLFIFIPTGRAINPVTGTNWEGTGVIPEVAVSRDEALEKALELARSSLQGKLKK